MNSVVRMHQARPRGLNQALLDLKRLWGNSRTFAEGKRKGQCPYRRLGLEPPTSDFLEALPGDPHAMGEPVETPKMSEGEVCGGRPLWYETASWHAAGRYVMAAG